MLFHMNKLIVWLILVTFFTSCYSFRGTSIPTNVNTFYVENFEVETYDAPYTASQVFTEKLKAKVRNESRLLYTEIDPDVEFRGRITGFRVSPVAPQNDQVPTANRLEITISVSYIDNLVEKNKWTSNFTFFKDFDQNQNLLDVRDVLSESIFDQLTEDIFNKAFSNW